MFHEAMQKINVTWFFQARCIAEPVVAEGVQKDLSQS